MRWIGESISALVPSAAIGGDIVRARLAAIHGASLPVAAGTVLVDITLGIFVQAGFTLLGLVLLVTATGKQLCWSNSDRNRDRALFAFAGFYFAQRLGIFRFLARTITRLAGSSEDWQSLVQWRRDAGTEPPGSTTRGGAPWSHAVFAPSPRWSSARAEIWLALWFLDSARFIPECTDFAKHWR